MSDRRPTVLVAAGEPAAVTERAAALEADYAVRRAYSGREARDRVDSFVDVVLLERRLSDLHGDDVLRTVRRREYDCRVCLVDDAQPGFDVAELDVDAYLRAPVEVDAIRRTVEGLVTRRGYEAELQEFLSLSCRLGVLEATYDAETLAGSSEYRTLQQRLDGLRAELEERLDELSSDVRPDVVVGAGQAST